MMKEEQLEKILDLVDDRKQQDDEFDHIDAAVEKDFQVMKTLATFDLKQSKEEKNKILTQRFRKFHLYNINKDKASDYFDEKPTINRDQPQELIVLHQKLLVYGTDFMSKSKIKQYFKLKDQIIRFLNSSTTQIEVANQERMKQILEKILINAKDAEDLTNLEWIPLKPYYQQGLQRKIEARLATNKDVFINLNNINSYIQKETKKNFAKQKANQLERPLNLHRFPKRREQIKNRQVYQKRQLRDGSFNSNSNNLSFSRKQQQVIEILSDDEQILNDNIDNASISINNMQFSMQLDISEIASQAQIPAIYSESQNRPQFRRFKYFNYKQYDKQKQREQNQKKKQAQLIVLEQ